MGYATERMARRVREILQGFAEDLIEFTRRLVSTPSENPGGTELAVARVIQEEARRLGLGEAIRIGMDPERPNLIYRVEGARKGPRLMLVGHVDTKPAGDLNRWDVNPFEATVRNGRLYGLGASDMKAGVAAMLYAGAAVLQVTEDLCGALQLAFVADEEAGGQYGAAFLSRQTSWDADAVLIAEPSGIRDDWDGIPLVCRGIACFTVRARGDQGHSGLTKVLGLRNASVALARALTAMAMEWKPTYSPHPFCPEGPTVNAGVRIRGGVFFGVNPGEAEFDTDVRTIPGMSEEQLRADVQALLDQLRGEDPCREYEVVWAPPPLNWIPPVEIRADHPLVTAVRAAAFEVLGRELPFTAYPASTDAAHFAVSRGIPTLPAFGPGLIRVAHAPNEFVRVQSIGEAAEIYALAAIRYLGRD